jgi:hypothetical protein
VANVDRHDRRGHKLDGAHDGARVRIEKGVVRLRNPTRNHGGLPFMTFAGLATVQTEQNEELRSY